MPSEIEICKENTEKHEGFFAFTIKIRNWKFQVGQFDRSSLFPFCIVEMPNTSSNVLSKVVYSVIGGNF